MAIRTRASLNATNPYFRRLRLRARQLLFCAPSVLALVLSLLQLQLQLPAWTRFRRSCYCEYARGKLKKSPMPPRDSRTKTYISGESPCGIVLPELSRAKH